jgi:glutathione synthase
MARSLRILVVMDDPARIDPRTDTTLALIEGACRRGHQVDICTGEALSLDGATLIAEAAPVIGTRSDRLPAIATARSERASHERYDAVLMREDAPVDRAYLTTTLLLERARASAVLINDPRALREFDERLFILEFPGLAAETRVTRSLAELEDFLDRCGGVMLLERLHPDVHCAGFVARSRDRNLRSILSSATADGRELVVATRGGWGTRERRTRILLLGGRPLGALLRRAAPGTSQGSLRAASTVERAQLTPRELEICAAVGARCRREGLHLVGINVTAGQLTSVALSSPTGLRQINHLEGIRLEDTVTDWLEARCAEHRTETSTHPPQHPSPGRTRRAAGRDRHQGAVMP